MSSEFPEPNPDFDSFLVQINEDLLRRAEFDTQLEELNLRINQGLDKYGVETILGPDLLTDDVDKQHDLLEQLTQEVYEAFAEQDRYIDSDETVRHAANIVATLSMSQSALFTRMKMQMVAFSVDSEATPEAITSSKLQLIAEWITKHGHPIDSEWVRFLNELLPGDNFTSENADDYVYQAMIEEASSEERWEKIGLALQKARESTGREITSDQVSELAMLAMIRHESHDMESRLDEAARKCGLTLAEGRVFVEILRREVRDS